MTRRTVISLEKVKKSYGTFELGPVDLQIEQGYVVAVVGPNGSGKSTLIRMLMNLASPDSGEVSLFEDGYPDEEVCVKQRVGYVPERSVGHDDMTARTLGEFVGHWYPRWNQSLYDDLLSCSEIQTSKKFRNLSKGMQRRLAFALAAATGAELLLLDEPTDGVDPFARRQMLENISRFMRDGDRTVVLATHVMEEVRRIADYVAFLVDGDFLGIYEKDALLEQWKTLWVDREPGRTLPGVVEVERGSPVRLITNSPEETRDALEREGISVVRTGSVDLEEILAHLMRESSESKQNKSPAGDRDAALPG